MVKGGFIIANPGEISEEKALELAMANSVESEFARKQPGYVIENTAYDPDEDVFGLNLRQAVMESQNEELNRINQREARDREAREARDREAREARDRAAREARDREARDRAAREAREREAREAREREAREREARDRMQRERETLNRVRENLRHDQAMYDLDKMYRLRNLGFGFIPKYSDLYYKNKIEDNITELLKRELIKESETHRIKSDSELIQLMKNVINADSADKFDSNTSNRQRFVPGDKIINISNNKTGVVDRLRDDTYEKTERNKNPTHYMYSITYDDGTFDTYVGQSFLESFSSLMDNFNASKPKAKKSSKPKAKKSSKPKAKKSSKKSSKPKAKKSSKKSSKKK
jgi:hypothetical protein